MSHHRNSGLDERRDRRRDPSSPFQLDGLALRFLQKSRRRPQRLRGRFLVTPEGQIAHDQRARWRRADHLAVIDHLVERYPQRRIPTLHDRAERIAHEQAIDPGGVEQSGDRVVVGRQHADLPPLLLPAPEVRNRDGPVFRMGSGRNVGSHVEDAHGSGLVNRARKIPGRFTTTLYRLAIAACKAFRAEVASSGQTSAKYSAPRDW